MERDQSLSEQVASLTTDPNRARAEEVIRNGWMTERYGVSDKVTDRVETDSAVSDMISEGGPAVAGQAE